MAPFPSKWIEFFFLFYYYSCFPTTYILGFTCDNDITIIYSQTAPMETQKENKNQSKWRLIARWVWQLASNQTDLVRCSQRVNVLFSFQHKVNLLHSSRSYAAWRSAGTEIPDISDIWLPERVGDLPLLLLPFTLQMTIWVSPGLSFQFGKQRL